MLNYETFLMRETYLIKKQIVLHVLFVIKIKKKKKNLDTLLYFLLKMIFTKALQKERCSLTKALDI